MVMIDLGAFMTVQQKNLPFQADFVARAFLKKGETGKAIDEYERLVSPDSAAREKALVHPFSRIRLAVLYEAKGDLDRAVEQYEILVKAWKGADPGLPEVAAARKKLTLLKARTAKPKGAAVGAFTSSPFYVAPYGLL
jgi:tetratricopeptide (TPR) repeat protein